MTEAEIGAAIEKFMPRVPLKPFDIRYDTVVGGIRLVRADMGTFTAVFTCNTRLEHCTARFYGKAAFSPDIHYVGRKLCLGYPPAAIPPGCEDDFENAWCEARDFAGSYEETVAATRWGYNPLAYIWTCGDMEMNRNGDGYREQPNLYEVYTFLSRMKTEELENMIEEECITHPDSDSDRRQDALINLFWTLAGIISRWPVSIRRICRIPAAGTWPREPCAANLICEAAFWHTV